MKFHSLPALPPAINVTERVSFLSRVRQHESLLTHTTANVAWATKPMRWTRGEGIVGVWGAAACAPFSFYSKLLTNQLTNSYPPYPSFRVTGGNHVHRRPLVAIPHSKREMEENLGHHRPLPCSKPELEQRDGEGLPFRCDSVSHFPPTPPLVMSRGNPWVQKAIPLPLPPKTPTPHQGYGFLKGLNIHTLTPTPHTLD